MDCRRGVSKNFADFYSPVIKASVQDLHASLSEAIEKVSIPSTITEKVTQQELLQDIESSIDTSLNNFVTYATSNKLAEGFYQVTFNEELPYKGDCNNPRRLTRKMPPAGESWTMDECKFFNINPFLFQYIKKFHF
jgi:hypothetical protein